MHRECALYTVLLASIRKENILEKFHPIIFFAYSGCIVNKQQQRQQRRSAFTDRSGADAAYFSFLIFSFLTDPKNFLISIIYHLFALLDSVFGGFAILLLFLTKKNELQ